VVAEVAPADAASLRPGAFAQVRVPVASAANPAIPATAVRPSERGFLAYIVVDGKAVERVLTLGLRTPEGRIEVLRGIAAGERLVVRGGDALRDGSAVRETPREAPPTPAASPAFGGGTP